MKTLPPRWQPSLPHRVRDKVLSAWNTRPAPIIIATYGGWFGAEFIEGLPHLHASGNFGLAMQALGALAAHGLAVWKIK